MIFTETLPAEPDADEDQHPPTKTVLIDQVKYICKRLMFGRCYL